VNKAVRDMIDGVVSNAAAARSSAQADYDESALHDERSLAREIRRLEEKMLDHARNLEFEQAAAARDTLRTLKERVLFS
jgi:excinuclease ABC subunit B